MRLRLVAFLVVASLCTIGAELQTESEKSEITKLEVIDLGEGESDADTEDSEVQRKRDSSGYSYKRPDRFTRPRFQLGQSAHKGRIVNKNPAQINRPVNKYGPPGYQNSPLAKPNQHGQQNRDKLQHHGHFNQQHSSNFDNRPNGLSQQEVPSPIRQSDFVEANPIASQNNEPFAPNAANYLPPSNQKLPGYSSGAFSTERVPQSPQAVHGLPANLHSQHLVQSGPQLSDAALFLTQNAEAIQQLYGAPATDQDFAPNDQFPGNTNQVLNLNANFENFESSSQRPQGFPGPLPSYASGTLSAQETLEQIQSLEKDKLIVQLQRALATQTQAQTAGRYAQNQAGFVQNQDFLASLGQQAKIHGLNSEQSTVRFGSGNTAFNQSPFLPGTTVASPRFPLSYGLSTTTQAPATTLSTTGLTTVQPQGTKDGTQVGSTLPAPGTATPASPVGFPIYGGFVPTLLAGTNFIANVPTYGPGIFTPSTVTSGSSPTHFGLPIPTETRQKPTGLSPIPSTTPATPSHPATPSTPPVNTVPLPANPVATPLHPGVRPLQPFTPLHPVTPLLPATPSYGHPVQSTGTSYGVQTSVINPVLYKPIKPVYPFYYYPNVAYHLQKPVVPTYPWSYAPSYAQAKPAQIWK